MTHDYIIRYRKDDKTKETKAEVFAEGAKVYGTVWCASNGAARSYAMEWIGKHGGNVGSITEE